MWIADRTGFYRYDFRNDTLENMPIRASLRVRSILVHRDKVWFATAEGLYAFDPRDKSVVTNAVDQGLLMPSVTALCADADRLGWLRKLERRIEHWRSWLHEASGEPLRRPDV